MYKNDYIVETIDYKGFRITVMQDDDATDPRTYFYNFGTMTCYHRNYGLPKECAFTDLRDIQKQYKPAIIMPVHLGQLGRVGYIFCTQEQIDFEFGGNGEIEKMEKAKNLLLAEIKEYNHYFNCEVYGYNIEPINPALMSESLASFEDSCWGYLGDYRGHMLNECKSTIDRAILSDKDVLNFYI